MSSFAFAFALVSGVIQVRAVDALAKCGDDVLHQRLDLGFGLWREIFFDIHLADDVAERVARRVDSTLFAGTLLRDAVKRLCDKN